jgi:carboxylesterase type B
LRDEGTLFSLVQSNITTNAQVIDYLASYFPSNPNAVAEVTGLVANYPNQPLIGQPAGSPFDTGALNNIYPQYKRLAAILGDITFTLTRRVYLDLVSSQVKSWSYLSDYFQDVVPVLGTFHGSDILVAFGTLGPIVPTQTYQGYIINFINNLDPNSGSTAAPLINWPQYTKANRELVLIGALGNSLLPDTFRKNASDYLEGMTSSLRV